MKHIPGHGININHKCYKNTLHLYGSSGSEPFGEGLIELKATKDICAEFREKQAIQNSSQYIRWRTTNGCKNIGETVNLRKNK